jgi:1-aminocyclopropane-1-carboxylate deaminase
MYKNIVTQTLRNPLHKAKRVEVDVLRLDLIHPVISGNKWFKLKHHIEAALQQKCTGLFSFGGAYSNHLVALAFACREQNLQSAAIIRGEQPKDMNHSLKQMKEYGMKLMFVSRESYKDKQKLTETFLSTNNNYYYVPEGGQSKEGIMGAGEILSHTIKKYTHILCAAGTGTTLAGLINSSDETTTIGGVVALRTADENNNDLSRFLEANTTNNRYSLLYDYHFGGYAKKNEQLISFMNTFYLDENIPTDFVYTGKMFYAAEDLIRNDYFSMGSSILLIHTGGLQGNKSLPQGTLVF